MLSRIGTLMVAGGFLGLMCIGGAEDLEYAQGVTSPFLPLVIKTVIALAVMAAGVYFAGGAENEK